MPHVVTVPHSHTKLGGLQGKVEEIARAISTPLDSPPVRIELDNSLPTDLAAPWGEVVPKWADGSDNNVHWAVMFRNLQHMIAYLDDSTHAATYNLYFSDTSGDAKASAEIDFESGSTDFPMTIPFSLVDDSSDSEPHGTYMYHGVVGDRSSGNFIFCNKGDDIEIRMTLAAPSPDTDDDLEPLTDDRTIGIYYDFFDGHAVERIEGSQNWTYATNGDFRQIFPDGQAPDTGYYRLNFTSNYAGTVTAVEGVHYVINAAKICLRSGPSYEGKWANILQKHRVPALAIKASNGTPVIQRGGWIQGRQLPNDNFWLDVVANDDVDVYQYLTSLNQVDPKNADTGLHIYMQPTSRDDMRWQTGLEHSPASLLPTDTFYDISNLGDYLIVACEIEGTNRDFKWVVGHHVEYFGLERYLDPEKPTHTEEQWNEALKVVKNLPQVTENPIHADVLWDGIKSAVATGTQVLNLANGIQKLISGL
jgi:hypothetical protein